MFDIIHPMRSARDWAFFQYINPFAEYFEHAGLKCFTISENTGNIDASISIDGDQVNLLFGVSFRKRCFWGTKELLAEPADFNKIQGDFSKIIKFLITEKAFLVFKKSRIKDVFRVAPLKYPNRSAFNHFAKPAYNFVG